MTIFDRGIGKKSSPSLVLGRKKETDHGIQLGIQQKNSRCPLFVARHLFCVEKKKTIEAMFSISISLPSLANKNYDLAEKEGNCHSRHFESNSGSISIAGKLRDAHKSTTLILSII